ncbi:hypothetical protein D3C85_1119330 [compost metagenome]
MLKQSERFGVKSSSMTLSLIANTSRMELPTCVSSGKTRIPSWISFGSSLSLSPSSLAEQIMPCDSTPRSLARLISSPPGRTAPIMATGTFCPASIFLAPHTICKSSPCPASITQTLNLSASGCFSRDFTKPTTTLDTPLLRSSTISTSIPLRVNFSANSSAVKPVTSTYSDNH